MTLTQEEISELKAQLLSQMKNLPERQRKAAEEQIKNMSAEALELMLKQQTESDNSKNVFRMIADKDIASNIIDENSSALAVLDINPISKGHILIIPKVPAFKKSDIPEMAFSLAKSLSKKIVERLNAKSAEIQTEQKFGEEVIHIIPIYDTHLDLNSKRQKSTPEKLEKISSELKLKKEKKPEIIRIETSTSSNQIQRIHRRIP